MLILRIGTRGRWLPKSVVDESKRVELAVRDLARKPGEPGLSVYRVDAEDEERQVAVRFAVTLRSARSEHLDYIVFPAEVAEGLGLTVAHVPQEGIDPYLSERHFEILGLTPELTRVLAAAILAVAARRVERLGKREIPLLASELCRRDPSLRRFLAEGWSETLAPLLGDTAP
jgi:hypothetical protein